MARVLVLGAGGPAGVNTCRALKAARHEVWAHDEDLEHRKFAGPYADRFAEMFCDVDVVLPQADRVVLEFAQQSRSGHFLPSLGTILICQDKFEAGLCWRRAGLRDDLINLVDSEISLELMRTPFWFRARHGAGAKAAICARSYQESLHWFRFWRERDPSIDFVAEAYLPGRDLSWASIWYEGELKASFARERLEYLYPNLTPEGLTGTPTRARIVQDEQLEAQAWAAVLAVDSEPHGIFCVDLREDEDGVPRPTEINAGRFSTTVGLWSIFSRRSNFVAAAVDLALTGTCEFEPLPEGLTLSRHIDCGHRFTLEPAVVVA